MLSASFNQNSNQGFRMNDLTSNFGYHENYNAKSELFNQFFNANQFVGNINQDSKMYSISEVDSYMHSNVDHNQDYDFGLLSISRSNSAHHSPFDNRMTPRMFSQSTSNTPLHRLCRDIDPICGNAPIMQLFNGNNTITNTNRQSPVELIEFQSIASKMGFLVGQDLEDVLNRSATMKNSNSSRISNFFKHKHGSSGGHNVIKQYLVIGVRVPSKEHVSEIVGKEGKKIKMIRQTTGALIATPNEKEDHVFLIEAVPETALQVGHMIQQLADQITRNKLGSLAGICSDRPRSPPVLGNRIPLATATIGVPQRLVGKVIGTQGSIITTVQKETGTEIKSPPKDELRAPDDNADFEISVYENGTVNSEETAWLQIHRAKQLIAHLVMRVWDSQPRNSTPSSSDEGSGTAVGTVAEWIWPEVSRMDDSEAKEIVDRILRSSKAKITAASSTSSTEGSGVITQDFKTYTGGTDCDWSLQQAQQQPRCSYYNGSAFFDSYSYYDPAWSSATKQTSMYGTPEDSLLFGNVRNIWRSEEHEENDTIGGGGGDNRGQPLLLESVYGTIGDGRKRYSAVNCDDNNHDHGTTTREDLL